MIAELFPTDLRRCARDGAGARGIASLPTIEVPPGACQSWSTSALRALAELRACCRSLSHGGLPGGSLYLQRCSARERPRSSFSLIRQKY
jgi:hypothetical protein